MLQERKKTAELSVEILRNHICATYKTDDEAEKATIAMQNGFINIEGEITQTGIILSHICAESHEGME